MEYPNAKIERVEVKFTGRIVLYVRCPYCKDVHMNDMGYITKARGYSYPILYRDSRCSVSIPYCPVVECNSPPHLYVMYYQGIAESEEAVYEKLKVIMKQRLKHIG